MQAMINPEIWYRPDSLIVIPQEDSVLWTDEYTIFSVVRSTNNESECLWSFKENDTVAVAVLTNGIYSTKTGTIRSNNARDFSKWCIFSYHRGIILDNNKQYKLSLGEQYVYTDSMAIDTLHSKIEMEEFAYFKGNVPTFNYDSKPGIPTTTINKVPTEYLQDYKDALGSSYNYTKVSQVDIYSLAKLQ